MSVERSKHGLKAIRPIFFSILLADVAVELLQYSVQFLHRDFFQFGLLAWLLRISTFESVTHVFAECVILLFQFFCFSTSGWGLLPTHSIMSAGILLIIRSTSSSQLVLDLSSASSKKLSMESPKSSEAGKLAIYNATHSQLRGISNNPLFL